MKRFCFFPRLSRWVRISLFMFFSLSGTTIFPRMSLSSISVSESVVAPRRRRDKTEFKLKNNHFTKSSLLSNTGKYTLVGRKEYFSGLIAVIAASDLRGIGLNYLYPCLHLPERRYQFHPEQIVKTLLNFQLPAFTSSKVSMP